MRFRGWCLAGWLGCAATLLPAHAQRQALDPTVTTAPRRTRLILKDGSYQLVLSYKVAGGRVRFVSAERAGETEEIPLALVDLPATEQWARQHAPAGAQQQQGQAPPPEIDPELAREEADRAALAPEIAPALRLAPEDAVLALDTWHGAPELVPLNQAETDLNAQTGHNVVRGKLNAHAASHKIVQLRGEKADVQMHVNEPAFYIRLDDDQGSGGAALTVDTHGASARNEPKRRPGAPSQYVIVRTDVREDARVIDSFDLQATGGGGRPAGVVTDTDQTALPGGHWLRLVPHGPLLIGEYVLVEVLSAGELNLAVWDFGIHPTAPENRDVLKPEPSRPRTLERRPR